jgi:invasion protein IalB
MTDLHRTELRPARNYVRLCFAALLSATVTNIAFNQPATSQQDATFAAKPAGTDIAPRGQRDVKDIAYGNWQKLCFQPGGAKVHCRTSITGAFATGQMAVRLDIIERKGEGAARLQVFTPVGMYLQTPVKLTVDQGPSHFVPYTWCLTNACIASAAADPKLIQEMYSAKMLRLEFVDSNLLTLTTSLPLGQFASVHKGAPAQTFEQDIDE